MTPITPERFRELFAALDSHREGLRAIISDVRAVSGPDAYHDRLATSSAEIYDALDDIGSELILRAYDAGLLVWNDPGA
jgi:hypothetical protein